MENYDGVATLRKLAKLKREAAASEAARPCVKERLRREADELDKEAKALEKELEALIGKEKK